MKGVVIADDRAAVAGARVRLLPEPSVTGADAPPAPACVTITDERGVFRFDGLIAGEWNLTAEVEGFLPPRPERFRIGEGPHPDVVIRMTRLPEGSRESGSALVERLRRARERNPPPEEQPVPSAPPFPAVAGVPLPDRWRLDLPDWDRYPALAVLDNPFRKRGRLDPYDQNPLKGDLPVVGQNVFVNLSVVSDTLVEARRVPTPSGQSGARPAPEQFFGRGEQQAAVENLLLSFEMFRGNAGFRPVDWRLRATAGLNLNVLRARERGVANIDVRRGTDRTDEHIGPQELFGEYKLADIGEAYDFVAVRAGVQGFLSDFRGFVFLDNQPGVRVFGSLAANRAQWNIAAFEMLEKDTNSGLNGTRRRHQRVGVANFYWQDFIVPGYTIQGSIHLNDDRAGSEDAEGGFHYDENGFLVRPAAIGDFTPHDLRIVYYGVAGDGHIGRINVTHAVYLSRGHEEHNPIADRRVRVRATMAAAEASIDRDWMRFRVSGFYASGDENPADGVASGFDSILDNPNFAGGAASFWNRQAIRLTGTNVGLVGRFSLLPDLRSSKDEGQANFVNPGLVLWNAGADFELTPKLRLSSNLSFLRFDTTETLATVLFQAPIRRPIGWDASIGALWRPWLNDNVVVTGALAGFEPASGFRNIYQDRTLYSAFGALTLVY